MSRQVDTYVCSHVHFVWIGETVSSQYTPHLYLLSSTAARGTSMRTLCMHIRVDPPERIREVSPPKDLTCPRTHDHSPESIMVSSVVMPDFAVCCCMIQSTGVHVMSTPKDSLHERSPRTARSYSVRVTELSRKRVVCHRSFQQMRNSTDSMQPPRHRRRPKIALNLTRRISALTI